jgi:UDP-glucose 4-epimerase
MKVLVTGADKFLGSHLVDRLVAENEDAVALDPQGGKGFITNKAKLYKYDYRSRNQLQKVFEKERPDIVCHLAADDTIVTSFEQPLRNLEHIRHSLNLLELCKQHHVKRLIYTSSAAVYGNPQYLPCDEQHPTHPVSPLGITQRAVENYLYFYWVNFGLDHVVLRTANVYGPRQSAGRDGGIISILISGMLRSDRVIINGDGMQERDFVFFSDVMDAVVKAIKLPVRKTERAAPTDFIYNLGTAKSISINAVFEMLKELIPYNRKPVKGPQRPCEVFEMRLHARHAASKLEWKLKVPLEEGIKKTLYWFKKKLKV